MNGKMGVIVATLIAMIGFGFILFAFYMAIKESGEGKLDERQMIQRGRAWRDTGLVMLILCALVVMLDVFGMISMSLSVAPYLIFSFALGFFSADNILRGAFFGFKTTQWKPTPIWAVAAQIAITLLGSFLSATDSHIVIGTQQIRYLNVIALFAFGIPIAIAYIIRWRIDKREVSDGE